MILWVVYSIKNFNFRSADSQVASRWGNIVEFRNFDLITPNEKEARFALANQDGTVKELASQIYELTDCKNIILKLNFKILRFSRMADIGL